VDVDGNKEERSRRGGFMYEANGNLFPYLGRLSSSSIYRLLSRTSAACAYLIFTQRSPDEFQRKMSPIRLVSTRLSRSDSGFRHAICARSEW
jgi:hypothetical protein